MGRTSELICYTAFVQNRSGSTHLVVTAGLLGACIVGSIADHKLELFNSCHLQLALQLAMQGSVSVWVGHVLVGH